MASKWEICKLTFLKKPPTDFLVSYHFGIRRVPTLTPYRSLGRSVNHLLIRFRATVQLISSFHRNQIVALILEKYSIYTQACSQNFLRGIRKFIQKICGASKAGAFFCPPLKKFRRGRRPPLGCRLGGGAPILKIAANKWIICNLSLCPINPKEHESCHSKYGVYIMQNTMARGGGWKWKFCEMCVFYVICPR